MITFLERRKSWDLKWSLVPVPPAFLPPAAQKLTPYLERQS